MTAIVLGEGGGGQPIDQRVGRRPSLRSSMISPTPSRIYISELRGRRRQSLFSGSTLPYLLLLLACSPFRRCSQPCRKCYYFHTCALSIIRHRHFQQQIFGVVHQVSQSIEVLLSPPKDLPVDVFGSTQRRHSSKITAFNP